MVRHDWWRLRNRLAVEEALMSPVRTLSSRLGRGALLASLLAGTALATPATASAQWVTTYEQFYLQAPHNWTFRNDYQAADRLFNAFDYGHAILYEKLWTMPNASPGLLARGKSPA